MRRNCARLLAAIWLPAALIVFGAVGALAASAKPTPAAIKRGRDVFNSNCAHCHGEDADNDDPYFNLPQLLSDKSDGFFYKTVTNGIDAKGMPSWKGIVKRRQMEDILMFLRSVERQQGLINK